MKKFYLLPLLFTVFIANAQLPITLTKAFNEPVTGDINKRIGYDTTIAISRATGLNQVWNFYSLVATSYSETSTFTNVASTPSPAVFPAATLAEDQGNSFSYTMWKSTGTNWEVQGIQFPGTAVNFSNTAIFATWPISFGYNSTDNFSGSGPSGTTTATYNGTISVKASGTGTVILPGGQTFTNCLQLTSTLTVQEAFSAGNGTLTEQSYSYYHSSQKFPILTIVYNTNTDQSGTYKSFTAFVNAMTGPAAVKENIVSNGLNVYPNPAKESMYLDLPGNGPVRVIIYNSLGSVVREQNDSTINIKDLSKGIYILSVKQNDKTFTKRIIIE